MPPPAGSPDALPTPTRLIADRRAGVDRRVEPRRHIVALMPAERRAVVDRRTGAERRSTVERRGRGSRRSSFETPAEHVRNALQLLTELAESSPGAPPDDLVAALQRLRHALEMLEPR